MALRIVSAILTGSLVTLGVASTFVAARLARRVVTPAARLADTRILALDTAAQTITLSRNPDTSLPGRYGLFTSGTESYLKLGTVLAETDTAVTRKLLTHIDGEARLDADADAALRPEDDRLVAALDVALACLGAHVERLELLDRVRPRPHP